ncbi:hypothetical protein KJ765_00500 [Candidatus Micrarchaeota archaeon]|nr:hypothetical protein [Candidatus Micrarchaeota archaeon]
MNSNRKTIVLGFFLLLAMALPVNADNVVGEVGSYSTVGNTSAWIDFTVPLTDPVVVAEQYKTSPNPYTVRVFDVNSTGFFVRLQADNDSYVNWNDTVFWVAVEVGRHTLVESGVIIEADNVTSNCQQGKSTSGDCFDTITYSSPFSSAPNVFSGVMTQEDPTFTDTTFNTITATNFQLALENAEVRATLHGNEQVGWIAWERINSSDSGLQYRSIITPDQVRSRDNGNYQYIHDLGVFPASALVMQTEHQGADGSWAVIDDRTPMTSTTIDVVLQEDQVGDAEQSHTPNPVSIIVFNQTGLIYDDSDASPPEWRNFGDNATTPAFVNDITLFYSQWLDVQSDLSTFVFSWNASGSDCGITSGWVNFTPELFQSENYTNTTKAVPTACENKAVGYRFYANDSNNIFNATDIGILTVSDRLPYYSIDPIYLGANTSTAEVNDQILFFSYWWDDLALSSFFLETNFSGALTNGSQTDFFFTNDSWANQTDVIDPSQEGKEVWGRIWVNDSNNQFNVTAFNLVSVQNQSPLVNTTGINDSVAIYTDEICVNVTAGDAGAGIDEVWVSLTYPNTSIFNWSLSDLGCNAGGAGDIYWGRSINVGTDPGTLTINASFANDTIGNEGEETPWPAWNISITAPNLPPYYNATNGYRGLNTTDADARDQILFYTYWYDESALSTYFLEWNGSASMANESAVVFSPSNDTWGNLTISVPAAIEGEVLGGRMWANDSTNQFNVTEFFFVNILNQTPLVNATEVDSNFVYQNSLICINASAGDAGAGLDRVWALVNYPNGSLINYTLLDGGCNAGGADDNRWGRQISVGTALGNLTINTTYANDTVGNEDFESPRPLLQVQIDVPPDTPPYYEINTVYWGANVSTPDPHDRLLIYSYWYDDVSLSTYTLRWNETGSFEYQDWTVFSPSNDTWGNYSIELPGSSEGKNISGNIWTNDTTDQFNSTPFSYLVVQQAPPVLNSSEVNSSGVIVNSRICVNASAGDLGVGVDKVWVTVTYPNSSIFNWSLSDTGCNAGGVGDNRYGREIAVGTILGDLTINATFANDSLGNEGEETPWPALNVTIGNQPPFYPDDPAYLGADDTAPVTLQNVKFFSYWYDDALLSTYSLEWNASGSMENVSWTDFSFGNDTWGNETVQIPAIQEGNVLAGRIWANDSANQFNVTPFTYLYIQNVSPVINSTASNATNLRPSHRACVTATAGDAGMGLDEVWILITYPNASIFNWSLSDTGCGAGGAGDNVYGLEIDTGNSLGTATINTTFANDTLGNEGKQTPWPAINITVFNNAPYSNPNAVYKGVNDTEINSTDQIDFYAYWYDDIALSTHILEWNGTGSMANESAIVFSPTNNTWSNYSVMVPANMEGEIIAGKPWANDSFNVFTPESFFYVTIANLSPEINSTASDKGSAYLDTLICINASSGDQGVGVSEVWAAITFPNGTSANISLSDTGCNAGGSNDNRYGGAVNVSSVEGVLRINTTFSNDTLGNLGYEDPYPNVVVSVEQQPPPGDNIVGEVGVINSVSNASVWVDFTFALYRPVVVAIHNHTSPNSYSVRIYDVNGTGFYARIQQPNETLVDWNDTVYWLAVERGGHNLNMSNTYIEAGNFTSNCQQGASTPGTCYDTITYANSFSVNPAVISSVQTQNDPTWIETIENSVGTASFQLALENAEVRSTLHGTEQVGWIAWAIGVNNTAGINYSAVSGAGVRGHDNGDYNVTHNLNQEPVSGVIQQTLRSGANGGWAVLADVIPYWWSTIVSMHIDEDQVLDTERSHNPESVVMIVFNATGVLYDDSDVFPPLYQNLGDNASGSITVADPVLMYSQWWDELSNLSLYTFSWNATGSQCGELGFQNDTEAEFQSQNWTNTSKVIPVGCEGKTFGYQFHANDSNNIWNTTDFGFVVVTNQSPTINTTSANFTQGNVTINETICINATVGDPSGIDAAWIMVNYPNGTAINLTLSDTGCDAGVADDNWYGVEVDVGLVVGNLTINTTFGNDTVLNEGEQSPWPALNFTVKNDAPYHNESPIYLGVDNSSPEVLDNVTFFSYWFDDSGLEWYWLEWNASLSFENASNASFSEQNNSWANITIEVPVSAEGETVWWRIWANGSINSTPFAPLGPVKTYPIVNSTYVNTSNATVNTTICVNASAGDKGGLDRVWAMITFPNGTAQNWTMSDTGCNAGVANDNRWGVEVNVSFIGSNLTVNTTYANDTKGNEGWEDPFPLLNVFVKLPPNPIGGSGQYVGFYGISTQRLNSETGPESSEAYAKRQNTGTVFITKQGDTPTWSKLTAADDAADMPAIDSGLGLFYVEDLLENNYNNSGGNLCGLSGVNYMITTDGNWNIGVMYSDEDDSSAFSAGDTIIFCADLNPDAANFEGGSSDYEIAFPKSLEDFVDFWVEE